MPPSASARTSARSVSAGGPASRKIPCDPETLRKYELPADYVAKPCQLCGGSSLDPTPFPADHPDRQHWGDLEPWGAGSKAKPLGFSHRLCLNIWNDGGFAAQYKNVDAYNKVCQADPTLNSDFMNSKKKLTAMKIANPSLRLRNKEALVPRRFLKVTTGTASRMKRKKNHQT